MSSIREVEVIQYNPDWPKRFDRVALEIMDALGAVCLGVEHIGSTSVPGLCAKDIIDVLCIVSGLEESKHLGRAGYVFKGELNVPLR